MRIFKGNGYRVYYAKQGDTLYLLLIGGSKDSQTSDISKACTLWQQVKDQEKASDLMTNVKTSRFDVAEYPTDETSL